MAGYRTWRRNMRKVYTAQSYQGPSSSFALTKYPNFAAEESDQETYSYRSSATEGPIFKPPKVTYNAFLEDPYNTVDTGHEFRTTKRREIILPKNAFANRYYTNFGTSMRAQFRGPLVIVPNGTGQTWETFPVVNNMSVNDINYYGAKAIASCAPTAPSASIATTIGEVLGEGFPNIVMALINLKERGKYFQGIGSASLALKFGLEPFVRDLQKILKAVLNANEILSQYERDSGKQVRRKYHFEPTSTITSSVVPVRVVQIPSELQGSGISGNAQLIEKREERIWFSGAFLYHAPKDLRVIGSRGMATTEAETALVYIDKVLGGRMTFETFWNLLPFSWLIDWIWNVGNSISNYTRFSENNLVLRYGYLMRETRVTRNVILSRSDILRDTPSINQVSRSFVVVKKERYKATPFGFGLNPNSFTEDQWAILAALGLTLGGKKLP